MVWNIKKYAFLILLILTSCSRIKIYTIEDNFKLKKLSSYDLEKKGQRKYYVFKLPNHINELTSLDSILIYVKTIYKKTQKKKYHRNVNEFEIINLNDSITKLDFKYPKTLHGENQFLYDKKNNCIYYIRYYSGKF